MPANRAPVAALTELQMLGRLRAIPLPFDEEMATALVGEDGLALLCRRGFVVGKPGALFLSERLRYCSVDEEPYRQYLWHEWGVLVDECSHSLSTTGARVERLGAHLYYLFNRLSPAKLRPWLEGAGTRTLVMLFSKELVLPLLKRCLGRNAGADFNFYYCALNEYLTIHAA